MILVVSPRQELVDLVHVAVNGACPIESRERIGGVSSLVLEQGSRVSGIILDARSPATVAPIVLDRLLIRLPEVTVIAVIDRGDTRRAVELVRHGATDCIEDPTSARALRDRLQRIVAASLVAGSDLQPSPTDGSAAALAVFHGPSAILASLRQRIVQAARVDLPVLITGETGVGKGVVAATIHNLSRRADRPFVECNMAAVSATLFESELFGSYPGAYTGASRRLGLFRRADSGTLFLDEIGDLPLTLQPKILSAVERGRVQPLGAAQDHQVNVRVLSATNRSLRRMVSEGTFRADLWHRIAGIEIRVPALREHPEDIPELVRRILAQDEALQDVLLEPDALRLLELYSWPGNVRELKTVLQRSAALSGRRRLRRCDLAHDFQAAQPARRRRRRGRRPGNREGGEG